MSNWVKENKFLTGYLAATAVGAGIFGYLLFSAKSQHDEVWSTYEQQAAELNRLENLKPYPNEESLKKLDEQRKEHEGRISVLQKNVATLELPIEQITPEKFQDQLRAAVTAFRAKAAQSMVKLPENFFLGFGRYETQPPQREAAPLLSRELKTIEFVLNQAAESRVSEIRSLDREELPEEKAGAKTDAPPAPAKTGGKGGADKGGKGALKKQSFEVTVFAEQLPISRLLNAIVTNKTQFLIPRTVQVKSEKEAGPSRLDPNAGAQASIPAPVSATTDGTTPGTAPTDVVGVPAVAAATGAAPSKFIVGEERLEVTMLLELIDFADPPSAAVPAKATAAK